jgi:hypothetical protein
LKRLPTMLVLFALVGALDAQSASSKMGTGHVVVGGATVPGAEFRYAAMSPGSNTPSGREGGRVTVVTQTEKRGGKVTRWWHLPGSYYVPAAAHDDTAGGLSNDGKTLVLSRFSRVYPPSRTRLAVLDTGFHLHRQRKGTHPFRRFGIPGNFSFHAISPDGSRLYLIQYVHPGYPLRYEVRTFDLRRKRLLPGPVVDPARPGEGKVGVQLSRETSLDGRWAYTLYASHVQQPFVEALDTVEGHVVYVDLPHLADLDRRFFYLLHLRVDDRGRELVVMRHRPGSRAARAVATVDTDSLEVRDAVSAAGAAEAGLPWLPLGGLAALLGIGFALVASGRGAGGRRGEHG